MLIDSTPNATTTSETPVCTCIAAFTTADLTGGTHSLTATYDGDGNYASSSSAPLIQTIDAGSAALTLASSAGTITFKNPVTFTASLPATATGNVTFLDGDTLLGTAAANGGTATFTTSALSAGSRAITAVYEGDANFSGSTSPTLTQTVLKASTTTSLAPGFAARSKSRRTAS